MVTDDQAIHPLVHIVIHRPAMSRCYPLPDT